MNFTYTFGKRSYDLTSRTHVMGILNVTPDSFSDGGRYTDVEAAIDHGMAMVAEGADIIDVGGESTRPQGQAYGKGADPVATEEEMARIIPVIQGLRSRTDVPLSVDTYKARVADEALRSGASIVNDISAFGLDAQMPEVVARHRASCVLMHMKGTPRTMQQNPSYDDLFGEVAEELAAAASKAKAAGVSQIVVDPGIGFGKSADDNFRLIAGLGYFHRLGYPILLGASRKSFLSKVLNLPIEDRLEGSLAVAVAGVLQGVQIVRVHDVRETVRAVRTADSIRRVARHRGDIRE